MRFVISLIFVLLMLSSCSETPGGSSNVEGFAPEVNCLETGGSWLKVPPDQYPENPNSGVFDPDNHQDYNYMCECPVNTQWTTIGCQ